MRKFLSILLSVAMLMTVLPASIGFAADETAKYTLTFRDGDRDGVVELGEELTYTWKFDSGYEYVNNLDFNIEYNADYLTPKSLTGKIISVTDDNWEVKPEENKITGYLMATGNVWTKEEVEDEDTGDISVNKLNLLVAKFTVKEDVPANTKANIVLNITNYQKYDNGGVDVPVEVAQYGEFTINPQEVTEQSSDATLKSLKYGDTAIELATGKYDYAVELEADAEIPAITAVANDSKASVADAVVENNVATIVVTAEDGTKKEYTITFTFKEPEKEPSETAEFALTDEFKALLTDSGIAKYSNISLKDDTTKTTTQNSAIMMWDEDGYCKARTYNVKYTPAGGTETTASGIKYTEMKAIVDDKTNTVASVTAAGYNYDASRTEVVVGSQFFTDAHNFGITGSAWDNAYHVYTTREFGVARANTASYFKDGIAPNGNTSSAYTKFAFNGGYVYTVTPDKDATVYYLVPKTSDATKAVLQADGWKNLSYIDATIPTDGIIEGLNAPSADWWNTKVDYNYEQYPYILTKMQYDTGSQTNSIKYFDIWYTEALRGDIVKIPANAISEKDHDAPKCFVKFEAHKSDDVTGKLTVGNKSVDLTSRFNNTIEVSSVNVGDSISVETNDATSKAELDSEKVESLPATVEATITAACGNKVKYTIKLMPVMPEITNVNYASGSMIGPYKMRSAEWKRGTATDANAAISPAEFAAIEAKYGKISNTSDFYGGTDMYKSYPTAYSSSAVSGYKYVDSPSQVTYLNTSRMFFDKGAYIFKHEKTRKNNSDYYYGGVGKYDGTEGNYYLTFDIDAAGTMYIVDLEGKGLPNATNEGYRSASNLKIAGNQKVYAKHYEANQTVKVPSYGWDNNWGYQTDARTWYNPSYFVFVFDSERDTTVESITLGGDAEGEVAVSDSVFDYKTGAIVKEGENVTLTVKTTDPNAIVEPDELNATVINGKAEFAFKVYSADMLAEAFYTVVVEKAEDNKIVNVSVNEDNNATWIAEIYTENATDGLGTNKYAVVDGLESGVTAVYSDRTNRLNASPSLNGATYVRVPKNQASGSFDTITVDADSALCKTGEDGEWIPATDTSLGNGNLSTQLRKVTSSSYTKTQFAENIENWISFTVTSDCTVILGDCIKKGYPNLDKDEWASDTGYWLNTSNASTYVKHFKAGEIVKIPSYGLPGGLDTVRTYKYTVNGEEQTYQTTLGDDYLNWDNVAIAVLWDDENSNVDIKRIKLNDEEVEATVDGNSYIVVAPEDADSAALEIVAADPGAVVEAPEVISVGETVEVKVTAVDGTEEVYTVTMIGETRILSVTVAGGTATLAVGTRPASDIGASYVGEVEFGAEITLTAKADEDAEFLYWKDADTNRIVSNDSVFKTTLASNASYVAVCASEEVGYVVTFVNANDAIIAQAYVSEEYKVPQNPYQLGYVFGGWATAEGLDAKLSAGDDVPAVTENTTYRAFYTKAETEYSITVSLDGEMVIEDTRTYNELVNLNDAPAQMGEKVFSHWEKNGKIVSYSIDYSFYMPNCDVKINAVYADIAAEATATVVMAEPVLVDTDKISFFMERNANGCEVLESGILLSSTATEITLDAYELRAKAQQTTSPGQFTVRKANVKPGDTWNAVAYMVYKAADGEIITIYSDVVSYSIKNPADYTPEFDRIEDGGDVL